MFQPEERSSPVPIILIAVAAIILGAGVWYYFSTRTVATLSVPKTQLYAAHTTFAEQQGTMHVIGQAAHTEDDLYVIATLDIKNNLPEPLFLNGIHATYTSAAGASSDTDAPAHADLARLEQSFPDLAPLMASPLSFDTTIAHGATAEGTVLLHFPVTEKDWQSRKSATITVDFTHQPPQSITIP